MNQPVRILYVDDYPLDRELVRDALEKEHGGFELIEAASRLDFETTLAQGDFDLVLSDFNILGFEGLQVLEAVRATGLNLPVIIVTGTGSEEVAVEALKRGAADYIIKTPEHIQRLPHIIHAVLEKKRLEYERQQAEESLRASEARYRQIVYTAQEGIWMIDAEGRTTFVNPKLAEMLGYTVNEMMGATLFDFMDEEGISIATSKLEMRRQGVAEQHEFKFRRKDGAAIWTLINTNPVISDNGNYLGALAMLSDINERKQAEQNMAASLERERFLGNLIRDASVAIGVGYPDGRLGMCNPAFQKLTGYSEEDLKNILWNSVLTPSEWLESEMQALADLHRTKQRVIYEKEYIHKSGKRIPIELVVHPIYDADGNVSQYYAFITDITERKRAEAALQEYNIRLEREVEARTQELQVAQEQLVRQERLAVLGQVAGSVGHELRNPLGVISNAVYFLRLVQPDANEKVKEYLGIIDTETHSAEKIITDLLDFARIKSADRKSAFVSELVYQTLKRYPVSPPVEAVLELPPNLPPVFADPQQIVQVLDNLVVNACQAMPEGGRLTFSARPEGQMVAISIMDTGVGIPTENLKKLFEPLFTTKTKGIGLGLPVSRKLVEANGGRIEVQSEPGKGSTFTVYLQVAK